MLAIQHPERGTVSRNLLEGKTELLSLSAMAQFITGLKGDYLKITQWILVTFGLQWKNWSFKLWIFNNFGWMVHTLLASKRLRLFVCLSNINLFWKVKCVLTIIYGTQTHKYSSISHIRRPCDIASRDINIIISFRCHIEIGPSHNYFAFYLLLRFQIFLFVTFTLFVSFL